MDGFRKSVAAMDHEAMDLQAIASTQVGGHASRVEAITSRLEDGGPVLFGQSLCHMAMTNIVRLQESCSIHCWQHRP